MKKNDCNKMLYEKYIEIPEQVYVLEIVGPSKRGLALFSSVLSALGNKVFSQIKKTSNLTNFHK